MTVSVFTVTEVDDCGECPYFEIRFLDSGVEWCKKVDRKLPADVDIPLWCPCPVVGA